MKIKKLFMILLSLAILAGIIIYINPSRIIETVSAADPEMLLLSFAAANAALLLRIAKWKVLLPGVSLAETAPVQLFGITVSNLTPGKIGEPVKSIALKMFKGIPVSTSLPTVIWERIMDVIVMLIFGAAGIYLVASMDYFFVIEMSMLVFILLISVLLVLLLSQKLGTMAFYLLRKLPVLNKISDDFISSFYSSSIQKRRLLICMILTLLAWLFDGSAFYFAMLSFTHTGFEISYTIIFTSILSLSVLAGLISSLPGGMGSTEAVMIIMLGAIGISSQLAGSIVLVGRLMTFFYSIVLGYLAFLWLSRRIDAKEILREIGF